MGFKITKDNIHTSAEEKAWDLTGKMFEDYKGGQFKFRLLDDDENVYLYGVMDDDPCDSYEEVAFAPLDYFMNQYGCTEMQYRNEETKKYESL